MLIGCQNDKVSTYLSYNWGNDSTIIFENGFIHSKTHYDLKLNKMVGDTLFPIKRFDSLLIISQIVNNGNWRKTDTNYTFTPSKDTLIIDTFVFKLRNFYGPKLFMFDTKGKFITFLKLLDRDKTLILENYVSQYDFKIANYTIGDKIDRELFEITDISNYDNYTIEIAQLKNNKNIDFRIIGDSIIEGISQFKISNLDTSDIIKVINNKLGIKPEYFPKKIEDNFEVESFYWNKSGISIHLIKTQFINSLYSSVENWSLLYSDEIKSQVLIDKYKNNKPKSTIIK